MNTWLANLANIADWVVRFLLVWSWQALLLLGAALLITKLCRRHDPYLRYRVWLSGLFGVILLPLGDALPRWVRIPQQVVLPAPAYISDLTRLVNPSHLHPVPSPPGGLLSFIMLLIFTLWLGGVSFFLVRLVYSHMRIRRVRLGGRTEPLENLVTDGYQELLQKREPPRVVLSTEVGSPALCGLLHPTILLPADILTWTTTEERSAILRHELMHYLRRDYILHYYQHLLTSILFFHPMVRFAFHELGVEREMVRDVDVLATGVSASSYTESILKAAERGVLSHAFLHLTPYAAKNSLQRRIEMIKAQNNGRSLRNRWFAFVALAVAFGMLLGSNIIGRSVLAQQAQKIEVLLARQGAGTTQIQDRQNESGARTSGGIRVEVLSGGFVETQLYLPWGANQQKVPASVIRPHNFQGVKTASGDPIFGFKFVPQLEGAAVRVNVLLVIGTLGRQDSMPTVHFSKEMEEASYLISVGETIEVKEMAKYGAQPVRIQVARVAQIPKDAGDGAVLIPWEDLQ